MKISGYLSIFIIIATVLHIGWRLNQYQEVTPISILAPFHEPELGAPIFAQFVYYQALTITDVIDATSLNIPIYFPSNSEWLQIDLKRNNHLIQRWRYYPDEFDTITNIILAIEPPLLLDGQIQVIFSGKHISHANQNRAPRLFIETADNYYPDGNYFVADNSKKGDIAMKFVGRKLQWQLILNKWQGKPLVAIEWVLGFLLMLILLGALPYLLIQLVIRYITAITRAIKKYTDSNNGKN